MALSPIKINPLERQLRPPSSYLLSVAPRLSVLDGQRFEGEIWRNGVTWQPEPCTQLLSSSVDICSRKDFTDTPRTCEPWLTQSAFMVYDALTASLLELTPEEIEDLLADRIELKVSAAFAKELISGAISGSAYSLSTQAHPTALAATATTIDVVIAMIEADFALTMRGAQGMIHMSPGLFSLAAAPLGLLEVDGRWQTRNGHIIVPDAGYVGAQRPNGFGGNAAAGQDWVYGTGPVQYEMSEPEMIDAGDIGSTMTNFLGTETAPRFSSRDRSTRFRDVVGIVVFDPCPVTAALATYTDA